MDIGQEINRHLAWIESVASLFRNEEVTDEKLQEISQYDHCALGQWLDSDASAKYQVLPEFEELKESHESFHKLAGEMIAAIKDDQEEKAMTLYQQFIQQSQTVIGHLKMLREKSLAGSDADDASKT